MVQGGSVTQAQFLDSFRCLQDKCDDTCCQMWEMVVNSGVAKRYQDDDLRAAIEPFGDAYVMKREEGSGFCVKYANGLCGIHADKGESYLGDACYFYPRVTRKMGDRVLMTASNSCPEVTRLVLFGDEEPFHFVQQDVARLPEQVTDYCPEGVVAEDAFAVLDCFVRCAQDTSISPDRALVRMLTVARSLTAIDPGQWKEGVPFLLQTADVRLLPAHVSKDDPYLLLHTLTALVYAAKKPVQSRLREVIVQMEEKLCVAVNWDDMVLQINDRSGAPAERLLSSWRQHGLESLAPMLRRWLVSQLILSFFPYAGLGENPHEVLTIIAVRYATVRLALMAYMGSDGEVPDEHTCVKVVQTLSRYMDHLGEPRFSLKLYDEAGWMYESRMRGLIEGLEV